MCNTSATTYATALLFYEPKVSGHISLSLVLRCRTTTEYALLFIPALGYLLEQCNEQSCRKIIKIDTDKYDKSAGSLCPAPSIDRKTKNFRHLIRSVRGYRDHGWVDYISPSRQPG